MQEERNAAMQEYTLVMSERDTVHKEMDKLQEELSQASKKIKNIEQTTNNTNKEVSETVQASLSQCLNSWFYYARFSYSPSNDYLPHEGVSKVGFYLLKSSVCQNLSNVN